MTRVQAKIYTELSHKDVEQIDKGLAEHYDLIRAFANGVEIEYFDFTLEDWFSTNDPAFGSHFKYRVKPENAEQSSTPRRPKKEEEFFFLDSDMSIISTIFHGVPSYKNLFPSVTFSAHARKRRRLGNAYAPH